MGTQSYVAIKNSVLTDRGLSLRAKGLYVTICSYAGIDGFVLNVSRMERSCSDSSYAVRKAWKELKAAGYLRHFYSVANDGSFCHAYDILQEPVPCNGAMIYMQNLDRPNGDVHAIYDSTTGNFTRVPNSVIRSSEFPLKIKGLYSILSYFLRIPNFHFRMHSVLSVCREKLKSFLTIWKSLKISGLLKQFRHPSGQHNQFEWSYQLLDKPNLESPYFVGYRADGTVTITRLISQLHQSIRSALQREQQAPPASPVKKYVKKALSALTKNEHMRLNGAQIPLAQRTAAVKALDQSAIDKFTAQFKLPDNVRAPVPYVAAALYTYAQSILSASSAPKTSDEDLQWALDAHIRRIAALDSPSPADQELLNRYRDLQQRQSSMDSEAYNASRLSIFEDWKSRKA